MILYSLKVVVVASDLGGLRNVAVRSVPGIFTVIVLDRNDNLPVFGALVRQKYYCYNLK